jgi:hypothetical protein
MVSPERAARLIRDGLRRTVRIAFPRHLAWGLLWLSVLPPERIMKAFGFGAWDEASAMRRDP